MHCLLVKWDMKLLLSDYKRFHTNVFRFLSKTVLHNFTMFDEGVL